MNYQNNAYGGYLPTSAFSVTLTGYPPVAVLPLGSSGVSPVLNPQQSCSSRSNGGFLFGLKDFLGISNNRHPQYNYGCKKCDLCKGKGFLDSWGKPCSQTNMFKKTSCTRCYGRGEIPVNARECDACKGLGGLSNFGKPCKKTDMFYKEDCL